MNRKFKYDDKVSYKFSIDDPHSNLHLTGIALVKGNIRDNSIHRKEVVGDTYILEDLSGNFPNNDYPYKYFVCFECNLKSCV